MTVRERFWNVFEVLSPPTEYYDRIVKVQHYRAIASIGVSLPLAAVYERIEFPAE